VLEDVCETADLAAGTRDGGVTRSDLFDLNVLVRANNLLKASRTLLADGHWEVAASAARQLFELLVNMEYLTSQADPEKERLRYAKFGLLQYAQSRLREMDYIRATGRPVEEDQETFIRDLLAGKAFEEFRARDGRWKSSWSGKSTKALAELSQEPMRIKQYDQAFVTWSEETHAAPIALLEGMLPRAEEGWVERQIAKDDRETGQMILMLVTLFLELWRILPGASELDLEVQLGWTTALMDEVNARMTSTRDEES
jgi:hypothetical protein